MEVARWDKMAKHRGRMVDNKCNKGRKKKVMCRPEMRVGAILPKFQVTIPKGGMKEFEIREGHPLICGSGDTEELTEQEPPKTACVQEQQGYPSMMLPQSWGHYDHRSSWTCLHNNKKREQQQQ